MVLSTYIDAQEHLPYADDSTAATPMSEENGAIILPFCNGVHQPHPLTNFGDNRSLEIVHSIFSFKFFLENVALVKLCKLARYPVIVLAIDN